MTVAVRGGIWELTSETPKGQEKESREGRAAAVPTEVGVSSRSSSVLGGWRGPVVRGSWPGEVRVGVLGRKEHSGHMRACVCAHTHTYTGIHVHTQLT